MHRLTAKEFTKEDFSCDKLIDYTDDKEVGIYGKMTKPSDFFNFILKYLNYYRDLYNETKNEEYWWQINQVLPLSYNQTRTVTMNYAVLRNIIKQRKNHRLPEWHKFIDEMHKLPYAEELIFYNI